MEKEKDFYFSIIVPIYNVERYLPECVRNVLSQSYKNFEIILVDDQSPDRCGEICDNFAKEDDRIRVIHQKNKGLSGARNAGIEIANGDYLIFLDSDDYWDDNQALYHINQRLQQSDADVLVFPAKRYYEEKNEFTYTLNMHADRQEIIGDKYSSLNYLIKNNIYRAAAWNKVVKKSIIDEHQMRYKEGYLSEDMDWCGDLLIFAQKFDFYEEPFYVYRQRKSGSITKNKTEKLLSDKIYMCQKGFEQAKNLDDTKMQELLTSYYAYEYTVALGVSSGVKNKDLLQQMKSMSTLLQYDICDKVKKVNKLKKFLGYGLTRKALCFFVRVKH